MAGQAKNVHYKIDRPRTFTLLDIDLCFSSASVVVTQREQADGV